MKLSEIIEYCMVQTGEFIVGDISNINFDIPKFWMIAKSQISYYGKFRPVTQKINVDIPSSPYVFLAPQPIPDWISSVTPSEAPFQVSLFRASDKRVQNFPWRYDKPRLYTSSIVAGQFEITVHYENYPFTVELSSDQTTMQDVDIPNLDFRDDKCLELIRGKFMESLGMSRRAFTLQDFPIMLDADSLVSEGRNIQDVAKQSIEDQNSWHYAIGG